MQSIPVYRFLTTRLFIFFSLILLLKSALAWFVVFDDGPSWTVTVTELPFVWAVFCLIEIFASRRKVLYYVIANLLLTGILFAVFMYYKYYGVIATYHALQQANQVTAVSNSVFSLMDPYYLFIFLDVVVLIGMLIVKRKQLFNNYRHRDNTRLRKSVYAGVFVFSVSICLFNIVPNRASMNEHTKAEEMGILNYEAYVLLAKEKEELEPPASITQERIDRLKGISEPQQPHYKGIAKGKNVIIIQLESFQNFLMDLKIDGQEVTPYMNRLAKDNVYFNHFFQNVGQGNTSDAEYVVNTSFYIPRSGAATMSYAYKSLPSLPKLLKSAGYNTATFHTNVVEFWNRGELYKALGFDKYYDKEFFGEQDKVFFGASDEVLYDKTIDKLVEMKQQGKPFYAQVISMTAHHPFTIPDEKDKIKLPERYADTLVGDYIRSQSYADYTLGKFIDKLKASGIWDESVVLIYGDHLGLPIYSLDSHEKELMREIYGREYGYTDMIHIPLVVAAPGLAHGQVLPQTGGQVDILPTVANLTGVSAAGQLHFGQDLFNQTHNLIPQRYYLPSGSFIRDDALFIPGSGYSDGTIYPLAGGTLSSSPSISEEAYNRALQLLHLSDSYVSQLPDHS